MKITLAVSMILGIQQVAATSLKILTPNALKDLVDKRGGKGEIQSFIGNYGHISYGQNFVGELYYPRTNREGCATFNDGDFEREVDKNPWEDGETVMTAFPIVLLNHGTCTHVSKTMNAQNYGFKAVMIVDDNVGEDFEMLRQSADQQHEEARIGYQLRIPYFRIFTHDADLIKGQLKEALANMWGNEVTKDRLVNIQVDLSLSNPDNRVEYELWYSSVFDLSTDQIRDLAEYTQPFGSNILFTPRIMTFECTMCPKSVAEQSCVSDGLYCPFQPKQSNVNMAYNEVEVIKESLFEKCLYQYIVDRDGSEINYSDWFNYMISMRQDIDSHSNSGNTYDFATTPQGILRKLGYSNSQLKKINKCVEDSFMIPSDKSQDNSILEADKQWQQLMRVTSYPSITINNQTYTGDFDGHDISVALCASFSERPQICVNQAFDVMKGQDVEYKGVDMEKHPIRKLFIAGLFIIIANVAIMWVHKKFGAKSTQNEIQMEVNQAVSQYFALRGDEPTQEKKYDS